MPFPTLTKLSYIVFTLYNTLSCYKFAVCCPFSLALDNNVLIDLIQLCSSVQLRAVNPRYLMKLEE